MASNATMNPRLINELRHAPAPLPRAHLASHYLDVAQLDHDVARLVRHRLVRETRRGLAWAGS